MTSSTSGQAVVKKRGFDIASLVDSENSYSQVDHNSNLQPQEDAADHQQQSPVNKKIKTSRCSPIQRERLEGLAAQLAASIQSQAAPSAFKNVRNHDNQASSASALRSMSSFMMPTTNSSNGLPYSLLSSLMTLPVPPGMSSTGPLLPHHMQNSTPSNPTSVVKKDREQRPETNSSQASSSIPVTASSSSSSVVPSSLLPFLPPSLAALSFPQTNWCAKCNASFRMTSDLVYHMRSHHKPTSANDPVKKKREEKLRCNICGETFRERHHLTRHMTSHQ